AAVETFAEYSADAATESAESAESGQPGQSADSARSADEWAFAADESWRTVQSLSQSEPTSYTSAGLPRRQRGEQLMPGSAAGSSSGRGAGQPDQSLGRDLPVRDPADVRGRLSSFQQGVHRARHAANEQSAEQPVEPLAEQLVEPLAEQPVEP